MLPQLTPPTTGNDKEQDDCNVGGLLLDKLEDQFEDGCSTPTQNYPGEATPAPTMKDAVKIESALSTKCEI